VKAWIQQLAELRKTLLIDEADVARWTEAISRLLGDPDLHRDVAARRLARAHEKYAWPVVAGAHQAFFEELL
jgi:glycosyltransferase involved in cell wall biosynthesis